MIHKCFQVIDMTGGVLNLFPWIRHFAPVASGYKPLVEAHKPLWSFLQEVVEEAKTKMTGETPKSYINSYLEELANKSNSDQIHESFSGMIADLNPIQFSHISLHVLFSSFDPQMNNSYQFVWIFFKLELKQQAIRLVLD